MLRQGSRLLFGAVVAVSLLVLFTPGPEVPQGVEVNDKLVHVLLFAALACTGRLARVRLLPLVVGLLVYAGASEVLQVVLPLGRDGDWRDALADTAGIAVGLVTTCVSRPVRGTT